MPTKLTFAAARNALASRAPAGQITDAINRALERLLVIGGVKGLTERVTFTVRNTVTPAAPPMPEIPPATLVLPPRYSTILGCIIRGVQSGVAAEWYSFQPGVPVDTAGLPIHPITDMGLNADGLRAYHIPLFETDNELAVVARCRIQHTELVDDNDIVPVTNLSALGLAVDAVNYENAGDFEAASKYFSRAAEILREEKKELEPDFPASSPIRILHLGESSGNAGVIY